MSISFTRYPAAMLESSRRAYCDFLHRTSPTVDPFAYEARVHLFARDRSATQARRFPPGSPAYRELMTTAFRENSILERVFGATLAASSYSWPPRRRATIEAAQNEHAAFTSRVGRHLITCIGETALRWLMVAVLLALVICDLLLSRRPQSRHRVPRE